MEVVIRRLRANASLPSYATAGSVAFDLAAAEDAVIPAKRMALIATGLVIATPPGYALILAPRSSLFKKRGLRLANNVGIIDQDYCGPADEVQIALWNPGGTDIAVSAGERLAQGMFVAIAKAEWRECDLTASSRGGFGSSGGYR